jgi:hypothetical protein
MNTTFRLSTVALAAALCWQTSAHATATEAQMRSITLYGNVSIQEDSTNSWGPWAEFDPTAAGDTQPVAAPRAATDPYRPLAQTTTNTTPPAQPPVEGFCAGGTLCGFGKFQNVGDPNTETPEDVHPFRLNGTVGQGSDADSNSLPRVIQLSSTPLSTGSFQLTESGDLTLYIGEGLGYSRVLYNNQERIQESYNLRPDGERIYAGYDPEQAQVAHFNLITYVRGQAGVRSTLEQESWGVIGYTTSTADMSALRAGNFQATYSGIDHNGTPVILALNFGNATWSGTWNGGGDSNNVTPQATVSGVTMLKGNVGFAVTNGTITGSTISATAGNISATDGTILAGSVVQAALFGPVVSGQVSTPTGTITSTGPIAAGGVVDIRKTVAPAPQLQQPAASGQGYTNGRYVAPFLTINDAIRRNNDK